LTDAALTDAALTDAALTVLRGGMR